jgi:hypothetical protein
MTYTITTTRRQYTIKTSDGRLWHYPRSEKGAAAANRKMDALTAAGATEQAAPEYWLDDVVKDALGATTAT